jgi:hypothetical protein
MLAKDWFACWDGLRPDSFWPGTMDFQAVPATEEFLIKNKFQTCLF